MVRVLGPRAAPTSPGRAILVQHYRTLLPLSLYMPHLEFLRARSAVVDQLDVISIRSPQQPLCWWGAACNLIPSQMQTTYDIPGFHTVWRRKRAAVHDHAAGRGRPPGALKAGRRPGTAHNQVAKRRAVDPAAGLAGPAGGRPVGAAGRPPSAAGSHSGTQRVGATQ